MKKILVIQLTLFILIAIGLQETSNAVETKKEEPLYNSSLHYTGRGMAYWYDKENGGLETITGIPYPDLDCKHCHVTSCDACHKTVIDGTPSYSKKAARNQEVCLKCHTREASIMKIDKAANQEDVHLIRGM